MNTLRYNILIINRKYLWRGKHHRLMRYTKFYALILLLLNSSDKCLSVVHMLQRYILYLNSIEKMSLANLYSKNKKKKIVLLSYMTCNFYDKILCCTIITTEDDIFNIVKRNLLLCAIIHLNNDSLVFY